jgi:hypothetical protein
MGSDRHQGDPNLCCGLRMVIAVFIEASFMSNVGLDTGCPDRLFVITSGLIPVSYLD